MRQRLATDQRGTILLVFIITLPFLIIIALNYMSLSLTSFQVARKDQFHTAAQLAADAGADIAVREISLNNDWSGTGGSIVGNEVTGGEVTLHNDSTARTTYTAAVNGDDTVKVVTVTGRTYHPASSTTPSRSVSIDVDLQPISSGLYSVVSGAGGLVMTNSAKILDGDVLINGSITMSNTAQIGTTIRPVNVKVAHQICPIPPNATYPQVCGSGSGQPISMGGSSRIYGTVIATNQTNGSGMSNPGLVSGTVEPQALPTYNREAQKAAVATTITGAAASCTNNQTRVWAANTRITGNVSISNGCRVTVEGNVWITGNFSVSNGGTQVIVADSAGSTRPKIMVDGSSGLNLSNSARLEPNATGTGFELYTFYSTAGCSPDCATVTGTDLANSRTRTTISLGNSFSAASTILYAYWSQVNVTNSGEIGALIGQTIRMSNSSSITFGVSIGTGETSWVVKGYRRHF